MILIKMVVWLLNDSAVHSYDLNMSQNLCGNACLGLLMDITGILDSFEDLADKLHKAIDFLYSQSGFRGEAVCVRYIIGIIQNYCEAHGLDLQTAIDIVLKNLEEIQLCTHLMDAPKISINDKRTRKNQ